MGQLRYAGAIVLCGVAFGCGQEGDLAVEQQGQAVGGSSSACTVTVGGSATATIFQNGRVVQGSPYTGATDAMLIANSPSNNYGHYTFLKVKGGSDKRHDVMRWDLTSLPSAGTDVLEACMELTISYSSVRSFPAFELLRDWDEAAVTWNTAAAGVPWQTPGATGAGDLGTTQLGLIPAGQPLGLFRMQLPIALVQKWVSSPSTNHGLMFVNDAANDPIEFLSQQAPNASSYPKLVVITSP